MPGMTAEELAMLTDEEREGLDLDGEGDEDGDDDTDVSGNDSQDDDSGNDEADGKGDDEQAGRDDGQQPVEEQPPAPGRVEPLPLFRADVPADAKEQLEKINTDRDALAEKFEDGDMTAREFQAETRKLDKLEGEIEWSMRKAELVEESFRARTEQEWYGSVNAFLVDHPELSKNEILWNAFDGVVRKVTADKANHGLTDRQQLDKAYDELSGAFGLKTADAVKPSSKDKPDQQQEQLKPKKGQREIPSTLGKVPAADANDTDDGKYAALDRLMDTDPLGYEAALAKLSPAETDAYLASQ